MYVELVERYDVLLMQVTVHLRSRLRLKLIVTASQMISQGHITAQCVTNGLQQIDP